MGSGKSTVARLLARQIGWQHVDLDKRIIEATGLTIPEIFRTPGRARLPPNRARTAFARHRRSRRAFKNRASSRSGAAPPRNRKTCAACARPAPSSSGCTARSKSCSRAAPTSPTGRCSAMKPSFRKLYEERLPSYELADYRVKAISSPCASSSRFSRWNFSPR